MSQPFDQCQLQRLGLNVPATRKVSTLRVAAQQQVEIAKALTLNAKLLILDEPTAALGDEETDRLFEQIHRLKAEGVSFIYVSHRLAEIARIADRIVVLRDGIIEQSGTPLDLYDRPANQFVAQFIGENNTLSGVVETISGDRCAVRLADGELELHHAELVAFGFTRRVGAKAADDPLVLGALARMYVDAGNQGEAVRLYERILSRSPNDLDTLRAAGGAASAAGDLGTAERLFQRALQIAPDDPQTLAALGNIYRRQGRDSKALPLLRQAEARLQQQLTGGPKVPAPLHSAPGSTAVTGIPADNPFATWAKRGSVPAR